jgi:hypothetical protein
MATRNYITLLSGSAKVMEILKPDPEHQQTLWDILADRWWDPVREWALALPAEDLWRVTRFGADRDLEKLRAFIRSPEWLPPRPGRRMPTCWAIADYWADRDEFDVDLDEPHCFRCGKVAPSGEDDDIDLRWKRAGNYLARAHLVDRYPYGLDGCQNIVLLCGACHDDMPCFQPAEKAGEAAIAWVQKDDRWRELRNAPQLRW